MTAPGYAWVDPEGWQSRPFRTEAEARDSAIACWRVRMEVHRIDLTVFGWADLEAVGWKIVAFEDVLP